MESGNLEGLGTTLHAYGDTFSHVTHDTGTWIAYGPALGHAGAAGAFTGAVYEYGTGPDYIGERYQDGMYPEYVRNLARFFGTSSASVSTIIDTMRPTGIIDNYGFRPAYNTFVADDIQESSRLRAISGYDSNPVNGKYRPEIDPRLSSEYIRFNDMQKIVQHISNAITPRVVFSGPSSVGLSTSGLS